MNPDYTFVEKFENTKNSKEVFFNTICLLTVISIYARDIFQIDVHKFIFIGLAFLLALFSDINHIFLYLCFIAPIAAGLPYSYIFMIFLSVMVIKKPEWILNIKMMPLYIIIFIIEPLGIFYGRFSIIEYMRMLSVLIVAFAYMYNYNNKLGYIKACNLYLAGFILAGTDIVLKTITNASISYLLAYGIRLGDISEITSVEGITVTYDPNTLAIFSSISIAISIILLKNNLNYRYWYVLTIVFSVLIGIATMSRTFILLGAIILFAVAVSSTKSIRGYISIFGFLCILFVIFLVLSKYYPSLLRNITERFTTSDLSNGRVEIFMDYISVILHNPEKFILGLGIQAYHIKSGVYEACHNGIQEIFVTWGLIGSIAVAILFINIFKRTKSLTYCNSNWIKYLPMLVLLIGVQLIQFFSQYINIMVLLVTVSAAMINKRQGESLIDGKYSQ